MSTLRRIGDVTGRWFPVIVVAAGGVALLVPSAFSGGGPAVPWLLAVIMLGMGMTLRPADFVVIGKRPLPVLLGVAAQYLVMPLLGYGLALAFNLPTMLAVGMVLVGAAPGGTASNVMVFLARGDTALSVAMTTLSTLLAPLLTPLLVWLLAGEFLPVAPGDLFFSIVQVVLVPIVLGLILRRLVPGLVDRLTDVLPLVSVLGITAVVVIVVAGSASTLLSVGLMVILAVIVHNLCGLGIGYGIAKVCGLPVTGRRAIGIEVGMQNSGLAAALATAHFNAVAALPAAVFSVWHNVSGSLLAGYWSRRQLPEPKDPAAAAEMSPKPKAR